MKTKQSQAPLGAGLILLSSVVYATYGVWVKLLGDTFDNFWLSVARALLVVLFLLPFAIWRKELARIQWRRDKWWFVASLVSCLLISAPLYYAVQNAGIGLGMGINYAGIVLGAFLFGRLLNGEKYTKDKWLATALGLLGLWLVFTPSLELVRAVALIAALVSGLASGLNMVVNKKLKYSAAQTTILAWGATVVVNLPFIFMFNERLPLPSLDISWLYLICFAIASLLASSLLIAGLKLVDAGAAGVLGLLEIVFSIVFGAILFAEKPSAQVLLGMAVIMMAAAIPYIMHYKDRKALSR